MTDIYFWTLCCHDVRLAIVAILIDNGDFTLNYSPNMIFGIVMGKVCLA